MMKIAIDIRTAGGEKAGKGWYTFHLIRNILLLDKTNEYLLYSAVGIPGFEEFKNAELRIVSGNGIFWHMKVARNIMKENCDLFFAPSSYIIPAILPKKIKKIVTVHDLVAFLFPNRHNKKAVLIEKMMLKKALKSADKVLAVSNNTRKDLLDRFKISSAKVDVIYCGAGEDFKPLPKTGLSDFAKKTKLPEKFFLAVGTIEPRKNYVNLIKALGIVRKSYPQYHLVIVGKEGWQFEEVYEEIKKNYLQNFVHILGYISGKSLLNLYNLSEAFIFPSLYEGFGIPPLEAMKSGCPVIASFNSSIPEVVGPAGILIDPEKEKDLAKAMLKVIKEPQLSESLKQKGLIQSKKFSWELSAKQFLKTLKSLEHER